MLYNKPALTYEEQLQLLNGRGLRITDKERALRWLEVIGYFRLSAYFLPYKIPGTDNFLPDATFDDVTNLYKFDAQLRLLVMQAIDRIEITIRASFTYHFAHMLSPTGYTDPTNFTPYAPPAKAGDPPTGLDHAQFMGILKREADKSEEVFVRHFKTKYHLSADLPIWMVTELITFRTLARLHENSKKAIRKKMGAPFGLSQSQITSWVNCLAYIRNLCAHHARLWNREISIKPELTKEWKAEGIQTERMYCVFLVIDRILSIATPKSRWKDRLMRHILKLPAIHLPAMQFPSNWLERDPWRETRL